MSIYIRNSSEDKLKALEMENASKLKAETFSLSVLTYATPFQIVLDHLGL